MLLETAVRLTHSGLSDIAWRISKGTLGLTFMIPFSFFFLRGALSAPQTIRLLIGFFLGIAQVALGWFIEAIGLWNRSTLTHYELAVDLVLTLFIFSQFLKIIQDLTVGPQVDFPERTKARIGMGILHSFLGIQIIYGAFVAGLRAGYAFNSFPKMNDTWIPSHATNQIPLWRNFVENPAMVQFIHRWMGILLGIGVIIFYGTFIGAKMGRSRKMFLHMTFVMILVQTSIGIITLTSKMNPAFALAHQLGALLLFGSVQTFSLSLRKSNVLKV